MRAAHAIIRYHRVTEFRSTYILFKHLVAYSTEKFAYTQKHDTKDIYKRLAIKGWYSANTYITRKKFFKHTKTNVK